MIRDTTRDYVVCLCTDRTEPSVLNEAMMPLHHVGADGRAYFTEDEDGTYASCWRHPTPEELAGYFSMMNNRRFPGAARNPIEPSEPA